MINALLYNRFFPRKMEKVEYCLTRGITIFRNHRKIGGFTISGEPNNCRFFSKVILKTC
jgi:hypothetical protein